MTVASILKAKGRHVETTRPDTTLYTVLWDLKRKNIGAVVVTDDADRVLGILSERDIVRALTERGAKLLTSMVSEVMVAPVFCTPDEPIDSVMARMTRSRVRHLAVVEAERLCEIVSIGDVVKHRLDELKLEASVLRDSLMSRH